MGQLMDFRALNGILAAENTPPEDVMVEAYFSAIIGKDRYRCAPDREGVLAGYGIILDGTDPELSYNVFMDCVTLFTAKDEDAIHLQNRRSGVLAGRHRARYKISDNVECENYLRNKYQDIDSALIDTVNLELETDKLETESDDTAVEEKTKRVATPDEELILGFFRQSIAPIISVLDHRYSSLFSSCFGLKKPYGILTKGKVLHLAGKTESSVDRITVDLVKMFDVVESYFNNSFEISECRAITTVIEKLYSNYTAGERRLVYFPYKMMEFVYGCKKPTGSSQESKTTYQKHSSAKSWNRFAKEEVFADSEFSLSGLLDKAVVMFVEQELKEKGYDSENLIGIMDDVQQFLTYVRDSLSLCFFLPEYSITKGVVSLFKLRLCDPNNQLGNRDLAEEIVQKAYLGGMGSDPLRIPPDIVETACVKSYGHEFNHKTSQAKPLFSYKAFDICKENGVIPTWDNMILGEYKDGSILTNGMHGVDLSRILIHHYIADSRAGKGVMTLNMLASAIQSDKAVFYLDDKPDMSSMFRSISNEMFVVNGESYDGKYDQYGGQYMFKDRSENINHNNIPEYLLNGFGLECDWNGLGAFFFMRALKLVLGIVLARGVTENKDVLDNLGGTENGILVVIDELTAFNDAFDKIVSKCYSMIPADKYEASVKALGEGKITQRQFDAAYNDEGYYALMYLRSLILDLETFKIYGLKSFNQDELGKSDIFTIGQSANYKKVDKETLGSMINVLTASGRYGSANYGSGLTKGGMSSLDCAESSFPYSMVSFRGSDAFIGRNDSGYLAAGESGSEARGRLDSVASNFAYISKYTDEVQAQMVHGPIGRNVELSKKCVYFKPYLVLNDATDTYLNQMFDRCTGLTEEQKRSGGYNNPNARITQDQILDEYMSPDGSGIHPAVGFPGYLRHMDVQGSDQILAKSGDIANYVVQNLLGYKGSWREFLTDLRPEWCFSVQDIVKASLGEKIKLFSPEIYPPTELFYEFNPAAFGHQGVDGMGHEAVSGVSGSVKDKSNVRLSDYMSSEEPLSGFIDEDQGLKSKSKKAYEVDNSYIEPEDEDITVFDSFGDEDITVFDSFEGSGVSNFNSADFTEPVHGFESDPSVVPKDEEIDFSKSFGGENYQEGAENISEIQSMLERFEAMGYDASIKKRDSERNYEYYDEAKPYTDFGKAPTSVLEDDYTSFGSDQVSDYERLVNLITDDIVKKYQGLERIKTFKVIGGTIVINKYAYQCKLGKNMTAKLPYDLRREINSGNISTLFNYSLLFKMTNLRELVFDSTDLVHDYVSTAMGYGSRVSVDLFFRDLKQLKVIGIGKKVFTRDTHWDEIKDDDVFYTPRASVKFLDMSGKLLGEKRKKAWNFTKNQVKKKEYGLIVKALSVSGGLAMTTAVLSAEGVAIGARKLLGGLVPMFKQFSNMLKE